MALEVDCILRLSCYIHIFIINVNGAMMTDANDDDDDVSM